MFPYHDSHPIRIGLVVFFFVVLGYAYYEGRALLYGPSIDISMRTTEVSEPFIIVRGQARRATLLSLNGLEIPATEEGDFSEGYVLAPGYNRFVLDARDRYGKTTERVIEIMYKPANGAPLPAEEEDGGMVEEVQS